MTCICGRETPVPLCVCGHYNRPARRPRFQHASPTSKAGAVGEAKDFATTTDVIVSWVAEHPNSTNREISAALMDAIGPAYDINAVSGRVSVELAAKKSRLVNAGTRRCTVTGKLARIVAVRS